MIENYINSNNNIINIMALNDTTSALPAVGADVGGFLSGLAPGLIDFVFNLAIVGGIIGIFAAIVLIIKHYVGKNK